MTVAQLPFRSAPSTLHAASPWDAAVLAELWSRRSNSNRQPADYESPGRGRSSQRHPFHIQEYTSNITQRGCATASATCVVNQSRPTGKPNPLDFYLSQGTSGFWCGSAGTRYKRNDFQYFEVGHFEQNSTDALSALTYVPGQQLRRCTHLLQRTEHQPLSLPSDGQGDSDCLRIGSLRRGRIYPDAHVSDLPSGRCICGSFLEPFRKVWERHLDSGVGLRQLPCHSNRNEPILTHYAFDSSSPVLLQLPSNFSHRRAGKQASHVRFNRLVQRLIIRNRRPHGDEAHATPQRCSPRTVTICRTMAATSL